MTTYRASVHVEDGTLHVARPLTAPDVVESLVTDAAYAIVNGGGQVLGIGLEVEVAGASDTPVGDSVTATSSQPLPPLADEPVPVDDDEAASVADQVVTR